MRGRRVCHGGPLCPCLTCAAERVHVTREPGDRWAATVPGSVLPDTRYGPYREDLEAWVDGLGFGPDEVSWENLTAPAPDHAARIATLHRALSGTPYSPDGDAYAEDLERACEEINEAEARGTCPRFLLVERSSSDDRDGRRWWTTHRTPWDAWLYHVGQESAELWALAGLIDLETGEPLRLFMYARARVRPSGEDLEHLGKWRSPWVSVEWVDDSDGDDPEPWDGEPSTPGGAS